MMGYSNMPSRAWLWRRATPVVVSSVPPITPSRSSLRSLWRMVTRSAPSSRVKWGPWSRAEWIC